MNPSICIIYSSIVEMTRKNSLRPYSDRSLLADEYNDINQSCSSGCLLYDFVGIYFFSSKRFHIDSYDVLFFNIQLGYQMKRRKEYSLISITLQV